MHRIELTQAEIAQAVAHLEPGDLTIARARAIHAAIDEAKARKRRDYYAGRLAA